MDEFPSNRKTTDSQPKQEDKKVEQVVRTPAVQRKKPLGRRLTETFVGGDARSVWSFVALDVLVPAAKDALADAVSQGVERMIFGEAHSRSRRTGRKPSDGPYISYNRMHQGRRPGPDPRGRGEISRRARGSHDFGEIILETRVEAEEVVDRLFDLVGRYEIATVADLYDLVGVSGSYTDNKWGWYSLEGSGVKRIRDGYLLELPKPEPLD